MERYDNFRDAFEASHIKSAMIFDPPVPDVKIEDIVEDGCANIIRQPDEREFKRVRITAHMSRQAVANVKFDILAFLKDKISNGLKNYRRKKNFAQIDVYYDYHIIIDYQKDKDIYDVAAIFEVRETKNDDLGNNNLNNERS